MKVPFLSIAGPRDWHAGSKNGTGQRLVKLPLRGHRWTAIEFQNVQFFWAGSIFFAESKEKYFVTQWGNTCGNEAIHAARSNTCGKRQLQLCPQKFQKNLSDTFEKFQTTIFHSKLASDVSVSSGKLSFC